MGTNIYDFNRFKGVTLSSNTVAAMEGNIAGPNLWRLNRLLLHDAYSNALPAPLSPCSTLYKAALNIFTNQTSLTFDARQAVEKYSAAKEVADGIINGEYSVKMRTFEAAMYSVARQEVYFRKMETNGQSYASSEGSRICFTEEMGVPVAFVKKRGCLERELKVTPIMTLTSGNTDFRLAQVNYHDRLYAVGDVRESNQNRTVFTMLSYLYAQTAISTQNLPVQQLIQVQ